jgi:hypothetical protein
VTELGFLERASGVVLPIGSDVNSPSGAIRIPFDRDISRCTRIATIGGVDVLDGVAAQQRGLIVTTLASKTQVDIETTDITGNKGINTPVHLAVFC